MRAKVTAFVTFLLLCLSVMAAPQASADAGLAITPPPNGTLWANCENYPFSYSFSVPSDHWNLRVDVTNQAGKRVEGFAYLTDYRDPMAGTGSFAICGGEMGNLPGTYTLTSTLEWRDSAGVTHTETPVISQFTLGPQRTKTTLKASTKRPAYKGTVVFRTTSKALGADGWYARIRTKLVLQGYNKGKWRKLGSALTDIHGKTAWSFEWATHRNKVKVRAVTSAAGINAQSVSRTVTIRVRD